MCLDRKIFQNKQAFRLKLDKTQGHNKQTFASLLGATPKLESIEHNVEQAAILIPLARWVSAKAPERLEAFVEDVSAFQVGQAVMLDHQPGWSREIREHSMIVSCSEALPDTEQGQQPALIAIS